MKLYISSLILSFAFLLFSFAVPHAQAELSDLLNIQDSDVSVQISPSAPGPFQNVTVELSSFAVDLNRSKITWTLDGKLQPSGSGIKKFSFRTGAIGKKSTLSITITAANGVSITKTAVINPSGLDILWESPDSYVPPFYEGKALPAPEATIKVVAIPNAGAGVSAQSLVYQWKRNYTISQGGSGFGKNFFTFRGDYLNNTEKVSVKAASGDSDGSYAAEAMLEIIPRKPQILFYEQKPLEGEDLSTALSTGFKMKSKESTFIAEPYYFSPKNILGKNYNYTWTINNKPVTVPDPKNALTIRPQPGTTGTGKISLSIENATKLFQSASQSLLITF